MALITRTAADVRPLPGAIIERYAAGGSVTIGDAVYEDTSGNVQQANSGAAGTTYAIGIVVACPLGATTAATGDTVDVVTWGRVTGFSGATPGKMTYSQDAAGRIGDAAGTTSHKIGRMRSATTLFVCPALTEA